jgi:gluconokinase
MPHLSEPGSRPKTIIVMGVSGCGKSTVGRMVAEAWGGGFLDADDFHSEANRRKMEAGLPLDDRDRWPWLRNLRERLLLGERAGQRNVLACSALKAAYRRILDGGKPGGVFWVWLDGPRQILQERMERRREHYMPPSLLESQLATLEEPAEALRLFVTEAPGDLVAGIMARLSGA